MSALSTGRLLRRHRRHLAVVVAVVALAGAVAAHHSEVLLDTHHDAGMGAVVELCLGIFTAVGAALVAVGLAPVAAGRRRPALILLAASAVRAPGVPVARARHGPAAISALCVSRR